MNRLSRKQPQQGTWLSQMQRITNLLGNDGEAESEAQCAERGDEAVSNHGGDSRCARKVALGDHQGDGDVASRGRQSLALSGSSRQAPRRASR